MKQENSNSLKDRYEVGLMVISVVIIIALVVGLTLFPAQGTQIAGQL
jgi:flagellar biosynthesis protein FliQ